jgi:hypothetical protein
LGTLSLEENRVQHGPDENSLIPLLESSSFFEKDIIQVTEGGEAVLDFGDQMQLRLFNDTELQTVSAEIGEDVPLGVQIYLLLGGFTGQVTEEEARAVFRTPGNVEITVLGTEFFIVYDPETEETTAGNFSGTVAVSSAGSEVSLEDGFYVNVPADSPPGPPLPLPQSRERFENQAREADSPIQAASQAKEWALEIRHEFTAEGEDIVTTFLRHWSGQFTLEGDEIVGSGTGVIEDVNLNCINFSDPNNIIEPIFNLEGGFDFDISGQVITGEDGRPAFMFEITADNLMTNSLAEISEVGGNCDFFTEFFLDNNRVIVEDLPLLDAETIVVAATQESKAVFQLNGKPYTYTVGNTIVTYEESIYFKNPLEVSIHPTNR